MFSKEDWNTFYTLLSRHVYEKSIVQIIAGNYSGDLNTWYLICETLQDLFQLQQDTSVLN